MKITLSPVRSDRAIEMVRAGETLIIDDVRVDLSSIVKGETREAETLGSEWILGDVTRDTDGVLHLALAVPYGPDAVEAARAPQMLDDPGDGPLDIPHTP